MVLMMVVGLLVRCSAVVAVNGGRHRTPWRCVLATRFANIVYSLSNTASTVVNTVLVSIRSKTQTDIQFSLPPSISICFRSRSSWPAPSKPLASPPEGKLLVSSSLPKPLARALPRLVVSKSLIGTALELWLCVKSASTKSRPNC